MAVVEDEVVAQPLRPHEERPRLEGGEEALRELPRLQELVPQQVRTFARVPQQEVL